MRQLLPGDKASDVPQVVPTTALQRRDVWRVSLGDNLQLAQCLQQRRNIGGGPPEGYPASIATSLHRVLWQTPPLRTV